MSIANLKKYTSKITSYALYQNHLDMVLQKIMAHKNAIKEEQLRKQQQLAAERRAKQEQQLKQLQRTYQSKYGNFLQSDGTIDIKSYLSNKLRSEKISKKFNSHGLTGMIQF